MIPESAGATPYGIFLLADDYLSAAKLAFGDPKIGTGPVRLMSYHAAELFLKTYMRSAGETVDALRALGHDLERMVVRAKALGLKLPAQILAQSRKLTANTTTCGHATWWSERPPTSPTRAFFDTVGRLGRASSRRSIWTSKVCPKVSIGLAPCHPIIRKKCRQSRHDPRDSRRECRSKGSSEPRTWFKRRNKAIADCSALIKHER